jgi:hypothetical protein
MLQDVASTTPNTKYLYKKAGSQGPAVVVAAACDAHAPLLIHPPELLPPHTLLSR